MTPPNWNAVRKKGVLQGIKTPNDYMEGMMEGMKDAAIWLLSRHPQPPSLKLAKEIHKRAMGKIVPFAGKLTKVTLLTRGFPSCDPGAIPFEFELLTEQFRNGLPETANAMESCRWAAFAAARWIRIHPFADGNKRSISLWLTTWLEAKFGSVVQDKTVQHRLAAAYEPLRRGEIIPFGPLLLSMTGDRSQLKNPEQTLWECPHRVAPNFDGPPPSLGRGRSGSVSHRKITSMSLG